MITSMLAPSRYVQGPGVLSELAERVASLGTRAIAPVQGYAAKLLADALPGSGTIDAVPFSGECTAAEVDGLASVARDHGCDVVVGLGGGKALDTAKALAHALRAPVVVCPTAASTDAPCSSLAVLYGEDGSFDSYLRLDRNPDLVLVDTVVIAAAPVRLLVAGMGDALSTYYEGRACDEAGVANAAGGTATVAALALSGACLSTLLDDGRQAREDVEARRGPTPSVERVVEANILLSGIGFESVGEACAHAMANALTHAPLEGRPMHGELVAYGTLVQLALELGLGAHPDRARYDLGRATVFSKRVGLPTSLAELGLTSPDDAELSAIAERACAKGETMGHMPFRVGPRDVVDAMRLVERRAE